MRWIHDFQLFLFDFDGLLVNTEEIHFLSYKNMLAARGFDLDWDFDRYCQAAHYDSDAFRIQIYQEFPQLSHIDWNVLYGEKKTEILKLLNEGAIHLMPGVQRLLEALAKANIKRCVVTHSADELVSIARKKNPIFDSIPFWITREHYSHPKPNPECYLTAIKKLGEANDRIIGFEDTPRGLTALLGTPAKPVLVCQAHYPEVPGFIRKGVVHYSSLEEIPEDKLP